MNAIRTPAVIASLAIALAAAVFMALPASGIGAADDKTGAAPPSKDSSPVNNAAKNAVNDARIYSTAGYDITPLPREKVEELAKKLDPETYRITQKAGTEPPFCGTLLDNKKNGVYCCVVCGLPLFSSDHKFNSGTGWPSFFQPYAAGHVAEKVDRSHGMVRTEINCARCDAHLGHVFDDGPRPTGLRFCLNGASLVFHEKGATLPPESQPIATETAYFAGGCFWGIEHYFQLAPGVVSAESGYMQGSQDKPTYRDVCTQDELPARLRPEGFKGHAEAVKVVYDPSRISFGDLMRGFFEMHDPTQLNRQGPDYGTQYRSGIYTVNDAQAEAAKAAIAELAASELFKGRRIVTEIEPAKTFFAAEDYHQDYLVKNPQRGCHIGKPWWMVQAKATAK
ncbi:MAG: Peptide methionine sulfoxide reductase MsrA 2 [Planctomycetota bacterium]